MVRLLVRDRHCIRADLEGTMKDLEIAFVFLIISICAFLFLVAFVATLAVRAIL